MMQAQLNSQVSRMPGHAYSGLDWKVDASQRLSNTNGANTGFTYMFPVSKYAEAFNFGRGQVYISYLSYMHGHQPYMARDAGIYTAVATPKQPNWYALKKVSPKTSAPGNQNAQNTMALLLARRTGNG